MTRLLFAACALAFTLSATGCDTYSYPTPPEDKESMKKQPEIYGEVDGPAEQSLNKYDADPEQAAKADAIKKQLFTEDNPAYNRGMKAKAAVANSAESTADAAAPAAQADTAAKAAK